MDETSAAHSQTQAVIERIRWDPAYKLIGTHNFSLLIALAILIAIFGALRPDVFFLARNIQNIGQAIAILGVLATAQTIVIISGGLDISVGSVVGMSTVCIATVVTWTGSTTLSIAAGIAVGIVAGLVNGLIVTVGRVNAVIATLGTMAAFRGVAFIISDGQSIPIFDRDFRVIGDGRFLGVQITIWILLAVVAAFFVLMRYTLAGRNIYAIGGNPVVARRPEQPRLSDRRLYSERSDRGPRRHAARGAHGFRTAGFGVRRVGAAGHHCGGAGRLRANRRQGNDRRRVAWRADPGCAQQRHDLDQRAHLLSDGGARRPPDSRRFDRGAAAAALWLTNTPTRLL
jgi:hypothetical protein